MHGGWPARLEWRCRWWPNRLKLPAGGQAPGKVRISSSGATTGRKPSADTRTAVSLAPGSGRVIRTPRPRQAKMSPGLSARRLAPSSRPSRGGVRAAPCRLALQQEGAIGARDQPGQVQIAVRQQTRVAADRRAARAVELRQQRSFGGGSGLRLRVLDGGEQFAQFGIVGP